MTDFQTGFMAATLIIGFTVATVLFVGRRGFASVDARPKGGDVQQAPFTGGAVGSEADETPKGPLT